MEMTKGSHRSQKSAIVPDVGRPRVRAPNETINIGFKAEPELVRALDEEAARLAVERRSQGLGTSKVSRTEAIKVILDNWLKQRSKPSRP